MVDKQQQQALMPLKDVLTKKYILGYRADFKNNLFWHQEQNTYRTIYPSGHNIVLFNSDQKTQQFYDCYNGTTCITAMAISPSRRWLAWAEEADVGVIIIQQIIESNSEKKGKLKILTSKESGSRKYVSLSFNKDETKLVSLTGAPEWNLIFWDIKTSQQSKSLGFTKIQSYNSQANQFYHCFFLPSQEDTVGVLGNAFFKLYKLLPDQIQARVHSKGKDIKDEQYNYISYCWIKDQKDESLIIGTENGELLLFNSSCEYKLTLSSSPLGFPIEVLCPYSRGFLVGCNDCTIFILERQEQDLKNPYKLDRTILNKDLKSKITSLLLTPGEDYIIIGLENGSLIQTNFSIERGATEDQIKFDPVVQSFHTDKITGLDVCIRKALVATCSLDGTVKVWSFNDHTAQIVSLENSKQFEEECHCLAFHPSGFHLVVGFPEKVKMLNIFENDIVPYKEISAKGVKEVSFSNGGQYFAIASNGVIQIYQTYTGINPHNLSFRGQTGKIKSIYWQEDDLGFYSASTDGQIYEFHLEDNSFKQQLFNNSSVAFSSVVSTVPSAQNERFIYSAGYHPDIKNDEEQCIYKIRISQQQAKDKEQQISSDHNKKFIIEEPQKIYTGASISQVLLSKSNKLFFFATSNQNMPGCLRVTRYPFTEDVYEIQTHAKPISRIKTTFDDNLIFTVGEDGVFIVYTINDNNIKIKRDKEAGEQYADEFLIQRDKYKRQIEDIEKLRAEIQRQSRQIEMERRIQMAKKQEQITALQDMIDKEQLYEKDRFEKLQNEKIRKEEEFQKKLLQLQVEYEENQKRNDEEHKLRITQEIQRYDQLQKEMELEQQQFEEEMRILNEKHEKEKVKKQQEFEDELKKEKSLRDSLLKEKQEQEELFDKKKGEIENYAEQDVEQIKEMNEKESNIYEEKLKDALTENRAKEQHYQQEVQKLEEKRQKLKTILEEIQGIYEDNKTYQKLYQSHEKEIIEREKTIKDKQQRIYDLKKKTQELEKFKFVLDYKIKELKRDIGPREEEIAKMKEQISNMNSEVLHFKRTNENLSLIVKDLHLRQKGMKKEMNDLTEIFDENENYRRSYKTDITEAYQQINDFKKLKKSALKLFQKYVQKDAKQFQANVDIQLEFINQRKHLETNVQSLKAKFEKNMQTHKQDNKRIMKENVDLIKEINDLKREAKIRRDEELRKLDEEEKKKRDGPTQQELAIQKFYKVKKNTNEKLQKLDEEISANQNIIESLTEQLEQLKERQSEEKQRRPSAQVKLPQISHEKQQQSSVFEQQFEQQQQMLSQSQQLQSLQQQQQQQQQQLQQQLIDQNLSQSQSLSQQNVSQQNLSMQ